MYRVLGTDGKEYGPVSLEQIKQWIVERRLNSNSMLQTPDSPGWRPLTMFPEFAGTLSNVTPAPLPTSPLTASVPRTNNMAAWGLGLSCFSLLCCPCGVFSVLGIVFSSIALSQLKNDPHQAGRPMAIAGIVVGALALLGMILAALFGAFSRVMSQVFNW